MRPFPLAALLLAACASDGGRYPSLAPRAAEAIDPRVPVESSVPQPDVAPLIASRIAQLERTARNAADQFDSALPSTRALVAAAGSPGSEGWVAAEQSISALEALRAPLTKALGDLDALATGRIELNQPLTLADQQAIRAAAGRVGQVDAGQRETLAAMGRALGR